MGEKFKPEFFELKNGKMKRLSPEKSAERKKETEREEKELEEKERKRTIRLNQDATFADLCKALIKIEEKAQEDEDPVEEGLPEYIEAELIDHFDGDVISEASNAIMQFETLGSKKPEEYTDEEKKLANLKVLEYFQEKGYSVEDIEAYLPLEFKKEKQKK